MPTKVRKKSKSKPSRPKRSEDDSDVDEVIDENEHIPFQRLESPCPPSPANVPHLTSESAAIPIGYGNGYGDVMEPIEEPEPFESLHYESDPEQEQDPRPPSQNSFASAIKNFTQEAKNFTQEARQVIQKQASLCGVNGDLTGFYQNDTKESTHEKNDMNDLRSRAASTNSLSSHFHKQKQQAGKGFSNRNIDPDYFNKPFPLSLYQKEKDINSSFIPLRQINSLPTSPEDPVPRLFNMRRSVSTPATFKTGRGSAFGKVEGKSSSFRNVVNSSSNLASPDVKTSTTSTGTIMGETMTKISVVNNNFGTSSFNRVTLDTPTKQRWMSGPASAKFENEVASRSCQQDSEDKITVKLSKSESSDDASVLSSQSRAQNQRRAQQMIKQRRRKKLQKQAENVGKDELLSINSSLLSGHSTDKDCMESITKESIRIEKEYSGVNNENDKSGFDRLQNEGGITEKDIVSYLPLEADTVGNRKGDNQSNESEAKNDEDMTGMFPGKFIPRPMSRKGAESPTTVPSPTYQKIVDYDQQLFTSTHHPSPPLPVGHRRVLKTPASPCARAATPPSNPSKSRLVLPLRPKGNMSPSSHDSASFSRVTSHSNNTSNQTLSTSVSGTLSCNRSVTSSVAEADREVREANRRELKRREGIDLDGTMSIQSSDTTSTNAYLALASSPAQLREGANIPYDRFFGCNSAFGPINSQSSNASSSGTGWHNPQNQNYSSPSVHGRHPASLNTRSPITVSSNSIATVSTGDEPPRFVSCSSKVVPLPPRSDNYESSLAYSKLGSSDMKGISSTSSRSSSSKSSKSKSKSKKKDKTRHYHKMGSAKVADHNGRTSTPSPCHSYSASPIKTPISPPNQFGYPQEPLDIPRPSVRRQLPPDNMLPGSKYVLVSPIENSRKREAVSRPTQNFWTYNLGHRAFQPTVIETIVTPEKTSREECN
mmetsp:Transcript_15366/g.17557  ORF Transcript_15366/g.17557 Transcript_15366/m.17557 type:complete len:938 (+) Transcript_15366:312-3125(+)